MAEPSPPTPPAAWGSGVPYRTLIAAIGLALVTYLFLQFVLAAQHVLTWMLVAGFFAVVLNPAVDFLVYRAKLRRTIAAALVFVVGLAAVGGLLYLLIRPIVDQTNTFVNNFPHFVEQAKAGKGTVGHLVKRYHIARWVDQHQARIKSAIEGLGHKAVHIAQTVGNTAAAIVTILVLTYLMLVEGPRILAGGVSLLAPARQERLRRIGRDAALAMTGYMVGNLVISVIAGIVTYVGLTIFGVPFRAVMAVWVGFADLIPLVGAMLGAIPTVFVALLHSPDAAIGMAVLYIVYQQFENHVLQVGIMARTVRLSPLGVLVSLLLGVELLGLIGALLAIPAAGVIQVVAKDLYEDRQRVKALRESSNGPGDSTAVDSVRPGEPVQREP